MSAVKTVIPRPDDPGLCPQQHDDADEQDPVPDDLDHHGREEVRQRRDVAVDALDQLAGARSLVEAHVEVQHMVGQLCSQLVGC